MNPLLHMMAASFADTPVYALPATEIILSTAPEGQTSDAQYIFNTDGTIQERRDLAVGGTSLTTSASSPWSTDPSEDGTGKYVKCVYNATGSTADYRTDVLGNGWLLLTSQRIFTFQNPDTSGPYETTAFYDVSISLDGSTVHDTQLLEVSLDNAGP